MLGRYNELAPEPLHHLFPFFNILVAVSTQWQLCPFPFENTDFLMDIPTEWKQWELKETSRVRDRKYIIVSEMPPYLPTYIMQMWRRELPYFREEGDDTRSAQNMKQQSEKLGDIDSFVGDIDSHR